MTTRNITCDQLCDSRDPSDRQETYNATTYNTLQLKRGTTRDAMVDERLDEPDRRKVEALESREMGASRVEKDGLRQLSDATFEES